VGEGELVCLIGANGAGKSSTLKAICRLIDSVSSTLNYSGKCIRECAVHDLPQRGLVMVPEGRGIFPGLTVEENLAMGAYARGAGDPARQFDSFPRLKERRRQVAGTLSGGEQQMLAIARALMSEPKLLLLDEPSMGLAPLMVAKIFEIVAQIARSSRSSPRSPAPASPSCWSSRMRCLRSKPRAAATSWSRARSLWRAARNPCSVILVSGRLTWAKPRADRGLPGW